LFLVVLGMHACLLFALGRVMCFIWRLIMQVWLCNWMGTLCFYGCKTPPGLFCSKLNRGPVFSFCFLKFFNLHWNARCSSKIEVRPCTAISHTSLAFNISWQLSLSSSLSFHMTTTLALTYFAMSQIVFGIGKKKIEFVYNSTLRLSLRKTTTDAKR